MASIKETYKENPYKVLFYTLVLIIILGTVSVVTYNYFFRETKIITEQIQYNEDGSIKSHTIDTSITTTHETIK